MRRKLLSILLSLAMVITMMPAMASLSFAGEANTTVPVELVKATTSGSRAVKLSWNKVSGATKYVVYGQKCGKKYKKLITTSKTFYKVKKIKKTKLKAHKTYKFYVVAYSGSKKLVTSKSIHFITGKTSGKYANAKSITVKPTSVTLEPGKTATLKATTKIYKNKKHIKKSHGAATRYVSDNPTVASVNANGVVTAKNEGTATIYVQDIGGLWCKTVVTVKKSEPPAPVLTPVDAPEAATGLIYNGQEQTGVTEATGYTVTNGKATGAGSYTATATLADGYKWSDDTTAAKQIEWSIAKVALTATADDKTVTVGDVAPEYTVTYTGWVNGESIDTVTPTTLAELACEYTTESPAGDYDITFTTEPVFANYDVTTENGKLTAAPETITLAEFMANHTYFPTTAATGWVNSNGNKMYYPGGGLCIQDDTTTYGLIEATSELTKIQGRYVYNYSEESYSCTITFAMNGDTLTSVTVEETSPGTNNGTYTAPTAPTFETVEDILDTVNNFPSGEWSAPDNAWKTLKGFELFKSTEMEELLANDSASVELTQSVTSSGTNWTCSSSGTTFTFNMTSGVLESVTVSGSRNADGTYYAERETLQNIISTYCSDFPTTANKGWKCNGQTDGYSMYIRKPDAALYIKHGRIDPISQLSSYAGKINGGYESEGGGFLLHFNIQDDKLVSIEIVSPAVVASTYTPADPANIQTIEDIVLWAAEYPLDKVKWNGSNSGNTMDSNGRDLCLSYNSGEKEWSVELAEEVTLSGGNYVWSDKDTDGTITFNMTNGVLTSITVAGFNDNRDYSNDTYTLPAA